MGWSDDVIVLQSMWICCPHENGRAAFSDFSTLRPVFKKLRFQELFRIRVDGWPKRCYTCAFSQKSVLVWTAPGSNTYSGDIMLQLGVDVSRYMGYDAIKRQYLFNLCVFEFRVLASVSFTSILVICTGFTMPSHQVRWQVSHMVILKGCSTKFTNFMTIFPSSLQNAILFQPFDFRFEVAL